jgi:ribonucleoside-diphosphate reductase alpha chain
MSSQSYAVSVREIVKRDGRRQPYDRSKIQHAVYKCLHEGLEHTGITSGTIAVEVAELVETQLEKANSWPVYIEAIQDMVETALMESGQYEAARAYIRYRSERERERAAKGPIPERFVATVHRAARNLDGVSVAEVLADAQRALYQGAPVKEVQQALVQAARARIEQDPDYSYMASRIQLEFLYEEALGAPATNEDMQVLYGREFRRYLETGVAAKRLDPRLLDFDLDRLALTFDAKEDFRFKYFGTHTIYDRYLLHEDGRRFELPQWFWMRVAMGLALNEHPEVRTEWAAQFYAILSQQLYCPSTPTLFNAGTLSPQLSSCFILDCEDSLKDILMVPYKTGMLSKWSGGLGVNGSKIRGMNALIKGTNGTSSGLLPWLKIWDATCGAVDQGGKRKGAWVVYAETWHRDIEDFIEARRNTGDERRRVKNLNLAVWVNDLFMQRLIAEEEWMLISPDEAPDLPELYGAAFKRRYEEYEALARAGKLKSARFIPAKDLMRKMIQMVFETGRPWLVYKDPCNVRSPQDHMGVIHSSNLCTEITLNTGTPKQIPDFIKTDFDRVVIPNGYRPADDGDEEVAVCNLGSLVISNHLMQMPNGDWVLDVPKLCKSVRIAARALDDVIDQNLYPIPEAERSNKRHRPVGLGMMGLQDALFMMDIPFESWEAVEFSDRLMEIISHAHLSASCELAQEKGAYSSFPGSKWSRGIFPLDTLALMDQERGEVSKVNRSSTLNWDELKADVMRHGLRQSNHMALAPTATIGNIIGTYPVTEPPQYNLYSESTMSGDFTQVNEFLVRDLKALGLWDEDLVSDLKYYNGSVQQLERVPEHLKRKYKTCYEIDPIWVIRAAAVRQKWIDQAQSTNIWYSGTSMKALRDIYVAAWEEGLKTTYYLRTKSATDIEKSTVDVNKYGVQPSWMKSKSASSDVAIARDVEQPGMQACRLDNPDCESCQ